MEQTVDIVPVVQLLHVPVPQMVDSVVEVLKILDKSVPDVEQVIEVPKILQHVALQRSSLQEPQLAEQLVEVPTIVSWSLLQLITKQNVDIPVPGGGVRGLQGFSPGQASTTSSFSLER